VVAGACWALAAVIAKIAFDRGVSPARMAEARVVVALAPLLVVLACVRRDLLRPPPGTVGPMLAFGLCVAGVNGSYYVAIDRLPVGVAISIQYVGPVLLLAVAALTGRNRPRSAAWVAGLLSITGAVLVSEAYRGLGDVDVRGVAAATASAALFAGYLLTAELAGRRGADPATVLLWGFMVAIVVWGVAAPWWSWPLVKLTDAKVGLAVLGVGVVGTLIPFFLSVGAVRVLPPATAGIAATSEPPFASAFAWIFLGQRLTGSQLSGAFLVVAGVVLAHRAAAVSESTVPVELTS
jgi:drug/metabolite transporter (DMT)-like permease